jgi:hypothetical protein
MIAIRDVTTTTFLPCMTIPLDETACFKMLDTRDIFQARIFTVFKLYKTDIS